MAEVSVVSCGKRNNWQHKIQSILIQCFVKQRRFGKNYTTNSASKERHVIALRHVSSESKSSDCRLQKKKVFKDFVSGSVISHSSSNRVRYETRINLKVNRTICT